MKKKILKIIKKILLRLFLFYRDNFYFKPIIVGKVFNGIGIGVVSNVVFVITTEQKVNTFNLIISFLFAIIFIVIGNIQKKD
jgi:hypothetical protein